MKRKSSHNVCVHKCVQLIFMMSREEKFLPLVNAVSSRREILSTHKDWRVEKSKCSGFFQGKSLASPCSFPTEALSFPYRMPSLIILLLFIVVAFSVSGLAENRFFRDTRWDKYVSNVINSLGQSVALTSWRKCLVGMFCYRHGKFQFVVHVNSSVISVT